jgi:hypothetical protein
MSAAFAAYEDWKRLGEAVRLARRRHPSGEFVDMKRWARRVGRSSRLLQGLERGEPVGADTRERIEAVLGWPKDRCAEILAGADMVVRDDGTLVFQPASMTSSNVTRLRVSDEQWAHRLDRPDVPPRVRRAILATLEARRREEEARRGEEEALVALFDALADES